jgi:methylglutaconyl-CoA hydratase
VAAVQGPALGGGCGLAAVCDLTIAAPEATFGFPEVRIGFVPAIVSVFLVRLVGLSRARDLLLTGRSIGAPEAHAIGLAHAVAAPGELDTCAREWATRLAANSPEAMAATRRLVAPIPPDELDRACRANADARATRDCREGVQAFLEKRPPSWG